MEDAHTVHFTDYFTNKSSISSDSFVPIMVECEENDISYKIHHLVNQLTRKSVIGRMEIVCSVEFGLLDCKNVDSIHYCIYVLRQIFKKTA